MNKIIIALDVPEIYEAEKLVGLLKNEVGAFKIGKQLFTRYGPEAVAMVHGQRSRVFLDLKFHDIPTTVAKAAVEVAGLGVFMFNIHALGGSDMMRHTVDMIKESSMKSGMPRPLVLAVTVLTSLSDADLRQIGIAAGTQETVKQLACLAMESGMDGVVASPMEIEMIRKECGDDFLIVTPGIRAKTDSVHDQKRTMTAADAIRCGASYIVVGRHVTASQDPVETVKKISGDIELS